MVGKKAYRNKRNTWLFGRVTHDMPLQGAKHYLNEMKAFYAAMRPAS